MSVESQQIKKRTNLSHNILRKSHFYIHIQTSDLCGLSHSYHRYGMGRKNMETTKRRWKKTYTYHSYQLNRYESLLRLYGQKCLVTKNLNSQKLNYTVL